MTDRNILIFIAEYRVPIMVKIFTEGVHEMEEQLADVLIM